jgi:hypothetical protein
MLRLPPGENVFLSADVARARNSSERDMEPGGNTATQVG